MEASIVPSAGVSLAAGVGMALVVVATLAVGIALGFWLRDFGEPKVTKKVAFVPEGSQKKGKQSEQKKARNKAPPDVPKAPTPQPPKARKAPKSSPSPSPNPDHKPAVDVAHEPPASPSAPAADLPAAPPTPFPVEEGPGPAEPKEEKNASQPRLPRQKPEALPQVEVDTDQSEPTESPGPVSPVSNDRETARQPPTTRAKERPRFVYQPKKPRLAAAISEEEGPPVAEAPPASPPPAAAPARAPPAAKPGHRRSPKPRRPKVPAARSVIGEGTAVPPAQRLPAAVQHVGAEATPTAGSVVLQWLPPDSPHAPVEAYFVSISPTGSMMRVPIGDVQDVEGLCEFTVKNLQPGRPVRFGLQAVNSFGAAPVGALSGVVVPKGPPYAVAALQAEARDGACVLRWPSPNDGGDPITEYVVDVKVPQTSSRLSSSPCVSTSKRVYRPQPSSPDAASSSSSVLQTQTTGSEPSTSIHEHTWEVTGLVNGQPYTFTVRAGNRFGLGPESRNSNLCTPRGPPRGVANVTVTLAPAGGSGCTVAWDPPPAPAGERVQCAVLLTGQGVESTEMKCKEGSKVNIRTLRPGKYRVAVVAGNLWGRSAPVAVPGTLHTDGKGGPWRWTTD